MATHYATLRDRIADGHRLRVQTESGTVIDVHTTPRNRDAAAAIWGGNGLSYEYRGARAYYVSRAELDERE